MLNLKEQKNSRKQGDIGVGAAIGFFTSRGYTVCIPLTESQRYDLVVEISGVLRKLEVKTVYYKRHGIYQVTLKTCGGNRSGTGKLKVLSSNDADLLFILTEDETFYLIPIDILHGRKTISLNSSWDPYKLN